MRLLDDREHICPKDIRFTAQMLTADTNKPTRDIDKETRRAQEIIQKMPLPKRDTESELPYVPYGVRVLAEKIIREVGDGKIFHYCGTVEIDLRFIEFRRGSWSNLSAPDITRWYLFARDTTGYNCYIETKDLLDVNHWKNPIPYS